MARIFITGSSQGLGFLAGQLLIEQGHAVVLHARTEERAEELRAKLTSCAAIAVGDVSTLEGMRSIADQVNALGHFNAVIHNVALGDKESYVKTVDNFSQLFAVNVLAPYVLTALIKRPERLVYLSSGMHRSGNSALSDPQWFNRPWNGTQAYSDSKLFDLILSMAVANRWHDVLVNAVDPGWAPTRMGGSSAPDDLIQASTTQAWLAVSDDAAAKVSEGYFYHQKQCSMHADADDVEVQNNVLHYLQTITGIELDAQ